MNEIKAYAAIAAGTFFVALAVVGYMEPCHIITGSVSGLALVISKVLPFSVSLITLVLNMVCLLAGTLFLGSRFGIRSIVVSVLLPLMIALMPGILGSVRLYTGNMIIDIALFLVILTLGQCILFASDTSSGGLDTIAEILARKTKMSRGSAIALCGLCTAGFTMAVYGWLVALTGVIVTFVNGKMVNLLTGFMSSKAFRQSRMAALFALHLS